MIPPRRRRRLRLWLLGTPAVLFLTVGIGTWLYVSRMVESRLANAIAEAERDDPNWQIEDLMLNRAEVPEAENSAIVVSKALRLLPENWPALPRPPLGQPMPPQTEIQEVLDRLIRSATNARLGDHSAEVIRADLKANEEAVKIARTVADYPRGRHELVIGPTLIDTLLPETQAARTAARLLQVDAAIRAHDGDLDGSLDSCRALVCVGRSIGDEPFLISMLVRIAIGHVGMSSATKTLGVGEPSDQSLARLQTLLMDEMSRPLLVDSLKGERATLTELIRRVGDGEIAIDALSGGGTNPGPNAPRKGMAPWGRLYFRYQRAVAIDWMNELVAISRRPPHERPALLGAWEAKIDQVRKSRIGLYTTTLPILLIPAVNAAVLAHSRFQSELGATILLLAAERHRRKHGDWPATLAAIDPSILPVQPLDPFSGKPFLMKHADGRLVIYSIGPNLKDQGGVYDPKKWANGGPDDVNAIGWDVEKRNQPPQE